MSIPQRFSTVWLVVLILLAKLAIHLPFIDQYGFHRDEYLYIAAGNHPAWGYWSNPPLIGWISWLGQHTIGDSIVAIRLLPLLASMALITLIIYTCRELGGGLWGQAIAGVAALATMPHLRAGGMFQPVIFDILIWTALTYFIVRYLKRRNGKDLLWFGVLLGIGLLNKLSILFFLFALLPVLAFSKERDVFRRPEFWQGAGITVVLALPYLIWQIANDFPVINHMLELRDNQLVNVNLKDFLLDQLLFHAPALFIWLAGLYFLLRSSQFRILAWFYLAILAVFILFSGKSYYTLGAYPVLMAAGGVFWEQKARAWLRIVVVVLAVFTGWVFLPFSLPVLSVERMIEFCAERVEEGLDGPMRWEDGEIHSLPQDYADMLGWPELAPLVAQAVEKLPEGEPYFLYADSYGHAGSIDYYGQAYGLAPCISFSDSYRLWAPPTTEAQVLIYVNDELGEDVEALFQSIELIGTMEHPHARASGTGVYLMRNPSKPFGPFWESRYQMVLGNQD